MKKFGKILFVLMFVFAGMFGMGKVKAATVNTIFLNDFSDVGHSNYGEGNFDYGTVGFKIKTHVSILKDAELEEKKALYNHAAQYFFENGMGNSDVGYVQIIPLSFTVVAIDNDNEELYVKIPESMLNARSSVEESIKHIRFARLYEDTNEGYVFGPVFGVEGSGSNYRSYVDEFNDFEIVRGSLNSFIGGAIPEPGYTNATYVFYPSEDGDYYAKIKTNLKDNTGTVAATGSTVYYALAICYTQEPSQPLQPSEQPSQPSQTVTTVVENPKTLDGSNSMYIVLGVIGLIGVIGLGSKFAKSSK